MSQDIHSEHSRLLLELRADSAAISALVTARIGIDANDYDDTALGHDELLLLVTDSCAAWLDAIAELPYSLEPARRAGRLKAERGIPLESLLHAFRLAGLAIWEIIVEHAGPDDHAALSRLSTLVWATVDDYSITATEAYRQVVAVGAEKSDQGLLRALLDPALPHAQRESVRKRLRLPTPATLVVLAGPVDFVAAGVTTVHTRLAQERVTLAAAVSPTTLDHALRAAPVRAGASRPFTEVDSVPVALDQARLALRCMSPADTGIHIYGSCPDRALIAANPALAADVFADVLVPFDRLPPGEADLLVQTALAWYELGGSTSAVGARLHLHRNTVLNRLQRIERLTATNFAVPAEAALLYLALQTRLLRPSTDRP
ncbi:helix-turn-helix domain-containing protein [Nocardia sp. NPDC001965]